MRGDHSNPRASRCALRALRVSITLLAALNPGEAAPNMAGEPGKVGRGTICDRECGARVISAITPQVQRRIAELNAQYTVAQPKRPGVDTFGIHPPFYAARSKL
jgi:hypothetical protein